MLTILGVGASVVGNIAASPPGLLYQGAHAAPPIVLALSLEALLRIYRHQVHKREYAAHAAIAQTMDPVAAEVPQRLVDGAQPARPQGAVAARPSTPEPQSAEPKSLAVTQWAEPVAVDTVTAKAVGPADSASAGAATLKDRVRELLIKQPALRDKPAVVARELSSDPSYTRKLVKQVNAELTGALLGA